MVNISIQPRHVVQRDNIIDGMGHDWGDQAALKEQQAPEIQPCQTGEEGIGRCDEVSQAERRTRKNQGRPSREQSSEPDLHYAAEEHLLGEGGEGRQQDQLDRRARRE